MVILGDDLDDVAYPEANSSLLAGDELIFGGVIFKLGPHVDLWPKAEMLATQGWVGGDGVSEKRGSGVSTGRGEKCVGRGTEKVKEKLDR